MTALSTKEKTHENLLRRAALRQGYTLVKSRRRDPKSLGYGLYLLLAPEKVAAFRKLDEVRTAARFDLEGRTLTEIEKEIGPIEDTRAGQRQPRSEMAAGDRYGHWTVLSAQTQRGDNYSTMLCRCDCGTERRVKTQNMRRGVSTSCGECEYSAHPQVIEPSIGDEFGWWKVIAEPNAGRALCQCRCGRERRVSTRRLRSGDTRSCGCSAKWRTGTFAPTQFEGARTDD